LSTGSDNFPQPNLSTRANTLPWYQIHRKRSRNVETNDSSAHQVLKAQMQAAGMEIIDDITSDFTHNEEDFYNL
jgi:hypothetical protein